MILLASHYWYDSVSPWSAPQKLRWCPSVDMICVSVDVLASCSFCHTSRMQLQQKCRYDSDMQHGNRWQVNGGKAANASCLVLMLNISRNQPFLYLVSILLRNSSWYVDFINCLINSFAVWKEVTWFLQCNTIAPSLARKSPWSLPCRLQWPGINCRTTCLCWNLKKFNSSWEWEISFDKGVRIEPMDWMATCDSYRSIIFSYFQRSQVSCLSAMSILRLLYHQILYHSWLSSSSEILF